MTKNGLTLYANRDIRRACINIHGVFFDKGKTSFLMPAIFQDSPPDEMMPLALSLEYDSAQGLMDELWGVNIRPSDLGRKTGNDEINAMKLHIETLKSEVESLRGIVDHFLGRVK